VEGLKARNIGFSECTISLPAMDSAGIRKRAEPPNALPQRQPPGSRRPRSQMMHMPYRPRHIENRRRRIALLAVRSISAAVDMILADIVLAAERVFKVPSALVERSTFWTAAFPMMHAASHISLTFPYAKKRTTKVKSLLNLGNKN